MPLVVLYQRGLALSYASAVPRGKRYVSTTTTKPGGSGDGYADDATLESVFSMTQ